MFVHLSIPIGQEGQGRCALPGQCAALARLAREPQLFADQWQKRLCREANRIQLRFDQAFARMHLRISIRRFRRLIRWLSPHSKET